MGEQTVPKKVTSISLAIILLMFVLSAAALFQAIQAFQKQNLDVLLNLLIIGGFGIILSTYFLLQTRKRMARMVLKTPQIITTILCQKCGFKNIKDFERGDYIFKEMEPCPKCNEGMLIASIYREVEEKK